MKFLSTFERTTNEGSDRAAIRVKSTDNSKSRRTKFLQGTAVFIAMFVALWWLLSRGEERSE